MGMPRVSPRHMPPSGDESGEKRGKVLGPDDLDIEAHDNVVPIDEGRYVIASDEAGAERAAATAEQIATESESDSDEAEEQTGFVFPSDETSPTDSNSELGAQAVKEWHEQALQEAKSNYGFHISSKSQNTVAHRRLHSDDVGMIFDGLMRWYAEQLDQELPAEDVLGILLTESDVRVRYPTRVLKQFLAANDLDPDDSIADLLQEISGDDGFVFPLDGT